MKKVTKNYNVFEYGELSEKAKEKVKNDYLINWAEESTTFFYETALEYLKSKYPNSNLDIEFDLSCCQGSGLNIYGVFALADFDYSGKDDYNWLIDFVEDIELSQHKDRYTYSLKQVDKTRKYYDVINDYEATLDHEYIELNEAGKCAIEKLVNDIMDMLEQEEQKLYKQGDYMVNEIDDEEMQETAKANGWEYLEDGSMF